MKQRRLLRQQKPGREIAILTDSCADIPAALTEKNGIYVLPLQIRCSEGVFRDGVDLFAKDIYRIQKNEMPASSLPLGSDLEETLIQIKADGCTHVIALMMSSGLSGTYNLVRQAVEPTAEELGLTMAVYDTLTSSLGTGGIALQLAAYLDAGMSFADGCAAAERLIQNTTVFFSVDTLDYLRKGGRIGKISAVAGSVLQIKPILTFSPDGQLTSVAKVRGRRLVIDQLLKQVSALYDSHRPFNLMVADGGAEPELRAELEKKLQKAFPGFAHYFKSNIGGVLSIYTGSGVLGAAIQFLD